MRFRTFDIITALILNLVQYASLDDILSCDINSPEPCPGNNQICIQKTLTCECTKGYIRVGKDCETPDGGSSEPPGMTSIVISIFTLALIICGLVLVIRKYNLIAYVRQKINQRRNNDVMYEDVMIGNDDPPLSP